VVRGTARPKAGFSPRAASPASPTPRKTTALAVDVKPPPPAAPHASQSPLPTPPAAATAPQPTPAEADGKDVALGSVTLTPPTSPDKYVPFVWLISEFAFSCLLFRWVHTKVSIFQCSVPSCGNRTQGSLENLT
jgi:hypothetical protein